MDRQNTYKILTERGFIYQCTDENNLKELFEKELVSGYIGFDVTADSLHVGHMLPLMALSWLDLTGHCAIALMGGGTSMVGDPSGRQEARKMLSTETIFNNMQGIIPQARKFVDLDKGRSLVLNNADWLMKLNLLEFLRDIGQHFSINRMLSAESYKNRLNEGGLSFFEFSYMLIQAYDFLVLNEKNSVKLQMGGQDQWGNIVAGIDLIRRVNGGQAYGATMPLLIDPKTGEKFGKTNAGAVWLDKNKTSVYDFYQFWRNLDDQEIHRLLNLFTFLPLEETEYLGNLDGNLINRAKEILAYEVTAFCHTPEEAASAYLASVRAFGSADPSGLVKTSSAVARLSKDDLMADLPVIELTQAQLKSADYVDLFVMSELLPSKSEARRLIRQGGAYIDEVQVNPDAESQALDESLWLAKGHIILRAGKKRYKKVLVS